MLDQILRCPFTGGGGGEGNGGGGGEGGDGGGDGGGGEGDAIFVQSRTLTSLPVELLMLVAEHLDNARCLASFAGVCTVCLAAAQDELRGAALAVVERCLVPGSRLISNAVAACPYLFCLSSAAIFPAGTFLDSASLIKLTLPASLTTIGIGAFAECCSLIELTIPATVTTIGCCAFKNCRSLRELVLPSLLERIGHGAFRGCASLTSLALPASLTSLGDYAFHGCSSLTEITVPASLTTIGYVAPDARPVPLSLSPPPSTRRRLRWLRAYAGVLNFISR